MPSSPSIRSSDTDGGAPDRRVVVTALAGVACPSAARWRCRISCHNEEMPELKRALKVGLIMLVAGGLVLAVTVALAISLGATNRSTFSYTTIVDKAKTGEVASISVNPSTGVLTGELRRGENFTAQGPVPVDTSTLGSLQNEGTSVVFANGSGGFRSTFVAYLFALIEFCVGLVLFLWLVLWLRRPSSGPLPPPVPPAVSI